MAVTSHGLKRGAANLVWVALVLVAIVLVNLIASRSNARLDLTADSRYTLDDASVRTAEELPGPVTVEAFFSANLPPQLEQTRREISDLLAEFAARSDGKLTYTFVDPGASEEDRARADSFELPAFPLQVESEDELSVRSVYAGLVFIFDDGDEERHETIEQVLPGMNYEYELTRALRGVIRDGGPPTLGVVYGDGGLFDPFLAQPMDPRNPGGREEMIANYEQQLAELFDGLYQFRLVDIAGEADLPEDIDGLFLFGPTAAFTDDMQRKLDRFVTSGRPVALFISPYKMEALQFDQPGFEGLTVPSANDTGLEEMLEHYGVLLRSDAVFDFHAAQVSAQRQEVNLGGLRGESWVPYLDPRLPEITNISPTSVLVPNMTLVAFLPTDRARPLSQSTLALTAAARQQVEAGALRVDEVLRTSDTSYRLEATETQTYETLTDEQLMPFIQALEANPEAPDIDAERGPFTVALTVEGDMTSFFDPTAPAEGEEGASAGTGRLFVVANGYWVQALLATQDPLLSRMTMQMLPPRVRNTVQQYRVSSVLLLRNTADWLAQDSDLVHIRARGQLAFLDTGEIGEGEKTFYKLFNIAGVPLIFCFLGLCGFLIRQARRSAIAQRFEPGK